MTALHLATADLALALRYWRRGYHASAQASARRAVLRFRRSA